MAVCNVQNGFESVQLLLKNENLIYFAKKIVSRKFKQRLVQYIKREKTKIDKDNILVWIAHI